MKDKCITIDIMSAYIFKYISEEDKNQFEEHLSNCDLCLNKFIFMQQCLEEKIPVKTPDIKQDISSVIFKLIKQKIKGFWQWTNEITAPQWALYPAQPVLISSYSKNSCNISSYRSYNQNDEVQERNNMLITHNVNNFLINLFISKIEENNFSIKIRVLEDYNQVEDLSISLEKENGGYDSKNLDGSYVMFDSMSFGKYFLIVEQYADEKARLCFEINRQGLTIKD